MENMVEVLEKNSPDFLIIQGDTTTAFLTALVSYYKKIKICHLEAGLRTYNKFSPFPEEINRQFVSRIADFNFAPTGRAKDNLINERIKPDTIFITGNTIVDALHWGIVKIRSRQDEIAKEEVFKKISDNKKIILVTMHRRESFGKDIENVCLALRRIAEENESVEIVYPVHMNPNVKKPVYELLAGIDNIILIDPLSYEHFLWLMYKSFIIVTDSGGIQEEAPTIKKPVLVIRNFTERLESVEMGFSRLVGTSKEKIFHEIMDLLNNKDKYKNMIAKENPYGDGRAAERIADIIEKSFFDVI
jgi:UDP-N-acetylglucosamine 2-epimerase (non-hydrolysing)